MTSHTAFSKGFTDEFLGGEMAQLTASMTGSSRRSSSGRRNIGVRRTPSIEQYSRVLLARTRVISGKTPRNSGPSSLDDSIATAQRDCGPSAKVGNAPAHKGRVRRRVGPQLSPRYGMPDRFISVSGSSWNGRKSTLTASAGLSAADGPITISTMLSLS